MSQQVLLLQVNDGELEDGEDAAHRLAAQKDGIVGSNVGENSLLGCRYPNNAITRVKVTPTESGTSGMACYRY